MPPPPFTCAIAGIDGTRAGAEAAWQGARLVGAEGRLVLVGVEDRRDALVGRWGGVSFARLDRGDDWTLERTEPMLRERIDRALEVAARRVGAACRVERRRVPGRASETLLALAAEEGADLLAVGTHGGSRQRGILLGRTATIAAHEAGCPVLIARPAFDPAGFPATVAVGYDGSPAAERALGIAVALAQRSPDVAVELVTCLTGSEAEPTRPLDIPPHFGFEARERILPDDALVDASQAVDLLIVGSRGLRGVRALGSTSESVAHRAASSVLIAR